MITTTHTRPLHTLSAVAALALPALPLFAQPECLPLCLPVPVDTPDVDFTDSPDDDDLIDGDACAGVFVSLLGNDANPGTIDRPMRTINAAIIAARLSRIDGNARPVYVARGTYDETLVFQDEVSVYGAYDPDDWSRSEDNQVTVNGGYIAAYARNISTETTYQFLTINGADAPTNTHAVGLLVEDNTDRITLQRCTINAGNGGPGATGARGTNGTPGTNGGNADGPAGGAAGQPLGGEGGSGGFALPGQPGQRGLPEFGFIVGGEPGDAGTEGMLCTDGNPQAGTPGADGQPGGTGTRGYPGTFDFQFTNAPSGGNGGRGTGGGGGGAGAGENCSIGGECTLCTDGMGGGGGGGAGTGGAGGQGGTNAGSSFAIYADNALTIDTCTINAGDGGRGGNGGQGGFGGPGGAGGQPGQRTIFEQGPGGAGGRGGPGGNGGQGGGGAGGTGRAINTTSAFVFLEQLGTNQTNDGQPGPGGAPNGPEGPQPTDTPRFNRVPISPPTQLLAVHGRGITQTGTDATGTIAVAATTDDLDITFTITQDSPNGIIEIDGNTFSLTSAGDFTGWTSARVRASAPGVAPVEGFLVVYIAPPEEVELCVDQPHSGTLPADLALARCPADINADAVFSVGDTLDFLNLWSARDPAADWNADNTFSAGDILNFLADWSAQTCP